MFKNKFLVSIMMLGFLTVAPILSPLVSVSAQQSIICTIFPFIRQTSTFGINSLCGDVQGEATGNAIRDIINLVVSFIFVGIIIFSIYVIIKAAIKYIRSEGDQGKVEEAQKAIKSVFLGIAALFIGLIGIVIVIAFFGAGGALQTTDINNPLLNSVLQES
jgi:heme/copper-type cytochrome/quinol oxidase subunit 2